MSQFGTIKNVDLRKIWSNEAQDFTPWLADNIAKLGDALGMEIEFIQREASVGKFSLDLLARDVGTGRNVIIENQFGKTDHDHFGKLLTYAAGFEASTIIWISETIREEHRSALEWLNQHTVSEVQFFGIVIEVIQIDDSKPAFNFKLVVYPNEWQRGIKTEQTGKSEKAEAYRHYFQSLIDELREKHKFTNVKSGRPLNWYSFSSGTTGLSYGVSFVQGNKLMVCLSIDSGDYEKNKAIFDSISANKSKIEQEIGTPLEWERLDDRQRSRIAVYREGSIDNEEQYLDEFRIWSIDYLLKFKRVFSTRIKEYPENASQVQ